jgi:hypothetical protein
MSRSAQVGLARRIETSGCKAFPSGELRQSLARAKTSFPLLVFERRTSSAPFGGVESFSQVSSQDRVKILACGEPRENFYQSFL